MSKFLEGCRAVLGRMVDATRCIIVLFHPELFVGEHRGRVLPVVHHSVAIVDREADQIQVEHLIHYELPARAVERCVPGDSPGVSHIPIAS